MSGRVRNPHATPLHAAAPSAAGRGAERPWTEIVGKGNKGKGSSSGTQPAGRGGGGYGLGPLDYKGDPLPRRKIDARTPAFVPRGAHPSRQG